MCCWALQNMALAYVYHVKNWHAWSSLQSMLQTLASGHRGSDALHQAGPFPFVWKAVLKSIKHLSFLLRTVESVDKFLHDCCPSLAALFRFLIRAAFHSRVRVLHCLWCTMATFRSGIGSKWRRQQTSRTRSEPETGTFIVLSLLPQVHLAMPPCACTSSPSCDSEVQACKFHVFRDFTCSCKRLLWTLTSTLSSVHGNLLSLKTFRVTTFPLQCPSR